MATNVQASTQDKTTTVQLALLRYGENMRCSQNECIQDLSDYIFHRSNDLLFLIFCN